MLPRPVRILSIGFYFFFAWLFLTVGAVQLLSAVGLTVRLDPAGPLLVPLSAFTGGVGWMALQRLRLLLNSSFY